MQGNKEISSALRRFDAPLAIVFARQLDSRQRPWLLHRLSLIQELDRYLYDGLAARQDQLQQLREIEHAT